MLVRRTILMSVAFALVATAVSGLWAGIISGKIDSVAADKNSVTVDARGKKQTFRIPASATVTLDGKKAKLSDLTSGLPASVFTDGTNNVTRLVARSEASASASVSKPAGDDASVEGAVPKSVKKKSGSSKSKSKNAASAESTASGSGPWPQFLGPNRDNISRETGLLKSWPAVGPRLLWTAGGLGAGYSSVSVAGGLVFTMGNRGADESILAVKLAGGEAAWEARSGSPYREGRGDGPRGVPTIDGDLAYALGANGDLTCVEAKSGQVRWRKNILAEFGGQNIKWGICESVLIDGDRLICTPGGQQATMVALNKTSGSVLWRATVPGGVRPGYASAIAIDVGGVRQYVQFTANGTIGVRAQDGQVLWTNSSSSNGTANCSAPVFFDDMVFTASGYGTGGAMLRLSSRGNQTTAAQGYFTKDMKNHHGGMVVLDGYLYGSNDPGLLTCIELKSGTVRWQERSVGKGSLTCADGNLIVRSENGPVVLVEASPAAYRELGRLEPRERSGRNTWSYPVVADGKLFLRDQENLFCYDLKGE